MTESRIRVLIVDDHPVVRDGVRMALGAEEGIEVVGEAASGREAVTSALSLHPDVVLMDLHMRGGSGADAMRELARVCPDVRCLALTMDDEDDQLFSAMRAGARGYLVKGAAREEIARAVRAVAAGEVLFGPDVAAHVAQLFETPRRPPGTRAFPSLSDRELVLLDLVARGMNGTALARKLGVAPKTIRNQMSVLLTKMGVPDKAAAIAAARQAGLGRDDRPR